MKKYFITNQYLISTLAILSIFVSTIIFFNYAYGGYDNWKHYLISHHLFTHPELSLNTWGKPVFSILCAPFSFFGFKGAQLFNVICFILFLWFSRKIFNKFDIKASWIEPVFVASAPIYFLCVTSSLTEPLFALLLIFSIYLFLERKLILCMLVLSLLPFVRNEGYFMWIPFCLAYLNKTDWWKCIFLGFGTIIFAVITGITHGDLLYVIHNNHYLNHDGHYGSGDWFHFLYRAVIWLGLPLTALLIISFFKTKNLKSLGASEKNFIFLTFTTFFIYFIIHVIFWRFGIMGSLGLERVFGGITPLISVGLYFIYSKHFIKNNFISQSLFFVFSLINIGIVIYFMQPFTEDRPAEMRASASEFILKNDLLTKHAYHIFDPQVIVALDLDNYDRTQCNEITFEEKTHVFNKGDIIFWDTYCDSEAGLPKNKFPNTEFRDLFFVVDSSQVTYKNQIYEVHIFQKIHD